MQDLTVTIIQADLAWENAAKNLSHFQAKIETIDRPTDLIVLPEMFTTGFSMNAARLAEAPDGASVLWLKNMAVKKQADVVASLIIQDQGKYFNRLFWIKPDGTEFFYDKRHLFRMAGEHEVYCAGAELLTVELKGWHIHPFICYDLRFPVWCRNRDKKYDAALFIANWPERRAHHWKTLLTARALENQCYVIGVNRIGTDGLGIKYSGDSLIIDPIGNVLAHERFLETVHSERLSRQTLDGYREKFPAWVDADRFTIEE